MRFLIRVQIPTEKGNQTAKNGTLAKLTGQIIEQQKPEAVYFAVFEGVRSAYIVADLAEPSQMVTYAEPWFLAFNAKVDFFPAMKAEDLMKGAPALESAVKNFG